MSLEYVGKFYGPDEIIEISNSEDGMVILELRNKENNPDAKSYKIEITQLASELVISDEPRDWNYVLDKKIDHLINRFVEISMEYGVTGGDMNSILQKLGLRYSSILDRSVNFLITGDDNKFVPGGNIYFDFSLNQAHKITKHLDESAQ